MVTAVNSIAAVKATVTSDLTVALDAPGLEGFFFWTAGDFSGETDDIHVVASNFTPSTSGAWVRQGASAITHRPSGSGAKRRPLSGKLDEWVSVTDFGAKGDADRNGGGTDDTAAIQAAIDASDTVYFPGSREGRLYKFSNLTLKTRTRLRGDGPRASVLRQIPTANGYALEFVAFSGNVPGDIAEGTFGLSDIGIETAPVAGTAIGIGPDSPASMLTTENLRIVNQHAETLSSPPYSVPSGTVAMAFDGGSNPAGGSAVPVFVGHHRNLEIRSFETAISARNIVNEQTFATTWIIDCKKAFDLNNVSTWAIEASVETHVENARGYVFSGPVANVHIRGGRVEMPVAGCYLIELDGSAQLSNVVASLPANLLILGDIGMPFLPGRKVLGTWRKGLYVEGFETGPSASGRRVLAGSTATDSNGSEYQLAVRQFMLGGQGAGNGRIVLGRNAGNDDGIIQNDGSHLALSHPKGVKFPNSGGAGGYAEPLWLGGYALWIDSGGKLRIRLGAPAGDTDGVVVGTQS